MCLTPPHGEHKLASFDSPVSFVKREYRGVIKSPSSGARLPGFEPLLHCTVCLGFLICKKGDVNRTNSRYDCVTIIRTVLKTVHAGV